MSVAAAPRSERFDFARLTLGLLLAAMAARLVTLWTAAAHGIEFTDEGYYLVWISDPFQYAASATQFGFAYHPLWQWLDGDVVALRRANIALTWALCVLMGWSFFRLVWPTNAEGAARQAPALALACAFGVAYPNNFHLWVATPSYNSLALQGLLLATSGALLMIGARPRAASVGALLLGVGGWLTYLGKPTTAAVLALLVVVALMLVRRWHWRQVFTAGGVATLLCGATAIALDGSLAGFHARQSQAIEMAKHLGVQPSLGKLLRVDKFSFSRADFMTLLGLAVALALAMFATARQPPRALWSWGALLLAGLLAVAAWLFATGWLPLAPASPPFRANLMLAAPLAAALAGVALWWRLGARREYGTALTVSAMLLLMPYAFAFGTGTNYWRSASTAHVFWVYGALAMVAPLMARGADWRGLLPLAIGVQGLALVLLGMAVAHPYRAPPLAHTNDTLYPLRGGSSHLHLRHAEADYLAALERGAHAQGFRAGDPMIDLTGQSPGTLFALGAEVVGQAWLLGGYPGSDRAAREVFARMPCETLAAAWVLMQPHGRRALSPQVLDGNGLDLERDFIEAVRVETPDGFGGSTSPASQILLKPRRSQGEGSAACRAART